MSEGSEGKKKFKTIAIVAGSIIVVAALATLTWSTVLGGDGEDVDPASTAGLSTAAEEARSIYDGVAAEGNFLGEMDAPLELIEFSSLDCEPCAVYHEKTLPRVLEEYVVPGDMRLDLELLVPEGSEHVQLATEAASALSFDNRIWQFADTFYRDRTDNPEGEPTAEYLEELATKLDLVYEPDFDNVGEDELVIRAKERANALADEWTIDRAALPQFLVGPLGGPYEVLDADPTDPDGFLDALAEVTGRYGF